jgi:phosphoglycerate dehydrogenase-like enzyme
VPEGYAAMTVKAVFTTPRSARHQEDAVAAAPEALAIVALRSPDRATLKDRLEGAAYLISERVGRIDCDVLDAAPDLQLVLRLGAMTHDIDLEEARRRGVIVCQRHQEGAMRVAEHVVLQILALLRHLCEAETIARAAADGWRPRRRTDENRFAYNWSGRRDLQGLHGKTLGILGFGEVGAELARRLAGWGLRLLYGRRTRLPAEVEDRLAIAYRDNLALLAESEVLVCLLPYAADTVGYLDAARLATMKPGAILANAGSGGVIDETALARALAEGRLAGAALDTFAVEPIEPDNPLVALANDGANVLLTPHIAGGAPMEAAAEFAAMYDPIRDHLAGRPPSGRIA